MKTARLTAFGLHLIPQVIAAIVATTSAVLGLMFRQNLTPVATLADKAV